MNGFQQLFVPGVVAVAVVVVIAVVIVVAAELSQSIIAALQLSSLGVVRRHCRAFTVT